MLLEDYQCLIEDETVINYLVLKGYIQDKSEVTDLRQLLEDLDISAYTLRYASELKDSFTICQRSIVLSKEQVLSLAIKHRLLYRVKDMLLTPFEFASKYNSSGFSEQQFCLVDPEDLIYKEQAKIKAINKQIEEFKNKRDSISTDKVPEFTVEDMHIKSGQCFSNYTERFRYLTEYYGDESDFWFGTDRKCGYDEELLVMSKAIKAQERGEEKIGWELCTGYWPYYYNYFVSELLSQKRVNLLYKDFEMLKDKLPDSFNDYFDKNRSEFATVYSYLKEHHNVEEEKQDES